jgi:hypothetical protein
MSDEAKVTPEACSKCKTPMAATMNDAPKGIFRGATFRVTAFLCQTCGHWNNLKRRKSWNLSPTAENAGLETK